MKLNAKKHFVIFLMIFSILLGLIANVNVISPFVVRAAPLPAITRTIGAENVSIGMADNNGVIEVTGNTGDVFGQQGIIIIEAGVTVTLILNNITRSSATGNGTSSESPIQIKPGANVTIILMDGTVNELTCNSNNTSANAPAAGIHVPSGASLTILGDELNTGELTCYAGAYGAGIGGGPNEACGNITILGGKVDAYTRVYGHSGVGSAPANGAGIGSGGGRTGAGGGNASSTILIGGNAIVDAKSAGNGAGIGGGGSNVANGGLSGLIEIFGNAQVTASST